MKSIRLQMIFCCVLAALAPSAFAQRGWIAGTVVDSLGAPLKYANVVLSGYTFGAMTDEQGKFRMEVAPGRYTLKGLMMGFNPLVQPVAVRLNEETRADLRMVANRDQTPGRLVEVRKGPPAGPVRADQLQALTFPGVYPESTPPVLSDSLEFTIRYSLAEVGDSTRVRVIASGKNVARRSVDVCGCLSFWNVGFGLGPEECDSIPIGGTYVYRGPVLEVPPRECVTPAMECDPITLGPGESLSRTITFSYGREDFSTWTGEVHVTCIFFRGKPGAAWVDTDNVMFGPLDVPIRPRDKHYQFLIH